MSRYEIVKRNEEIRYQKECPLLIVSSAITKDTQTGKVLAQIKFRNIASKRISAVYIQIWGKGIDGGLLDTRDDFVYLDLNVEDYTEFGADTPVYLSDRQVRELIITCKKIVYDDETVWKENIESQFGKLPLKKLVRNEIDTDAYSELAQELMEEKVDFSEISEPTTVGKLQICGCGKYYFEEEECPYCGKNIEWWKKKINENDLLKERKIRVEELQKKEEEERRKSEELRRVRSQNKKKYIMEAGFIGGIILICVLVYLMVIQIIIPSQNYHKACEYAENGKYVDAVEWMNKAGDYKDSHERKEEFQKMIKYQEAISAMDNEKYDEAISIWSSLDGFKDSKIRYNEACEKKQKVDYQNACEKIAAKEYEEAEVILKQLEDYQDSQELLKEVHYQEALEKLEKGEYSDAVVLLAELKDYKDAAEQSIFAQQKTLENPQVGDIVYYGSYEQDGDESNGKEPIAWRVYDIQDGAFNAVSVYCLDYRAYLEGNDYLNQWLEKVFTPEAFTTDECSHVRIQLMQLYELKEKFSTDEERTASATIYAKNKAHSSSVEECEYWYDHKSISNLENDYEAPLVSKTGNVSYITSKYMLGSDYVRPRLYYSVEALK